MANTKILLANISNYKLGEEMIDRYLCLFVSMLVCLLKWLITVSGLAMLPCVAPAAKAILLTRCYVLV
jgi:hypothetical protein